MTPIPARTARGVDRVFSTMEAALAEPKQKRTIYYCTSDLNAVTS